MSRLLRIERDLRCGYTCHKAGTEVEVKAEAEAEVEAASHREF